MPISASTLRALMAAGVEGEALLAIADAIDADAAAAAPAKTRSPGAERQARYRAKLSGEVTGSDVTSDGHSDVTSVTEPPQRDKSNPPKTSLRSDNVRTRGEWFSELWAVLPHRKGDDKQPALEKFCKIVRDAKDPEQMARTIIEGGKRYAAAEVNTERQYIRATLVWLNRSGWTNDYSEPPGPQKWPKGGGGRPGRGPSLADIAAVNSTHDLFQGGSDEPRDRQSTEYRSHAADSRVQGFAGPLREQDRDDPGGNVVDLQRASWR